MDEAAQAEMAAQGFFNAKLINLAAFQSQPPLDHYLEALSITLFGYTEFAIRIRCVIFGSITCVLFYLLLKRYYGTLSALSGYLFLTFNPWLIRYSTEGRPYALGVFSAVLFIFAFHNYLLNSTRGNFWYLTLVQLLFLCSIGFQPVILILTFLLSSFILCPFFKSKHRFRRPILLAASSLIAVVVFMPLFINIARIAKAYTSQGNSMLHKLISTARCYSAADFLRFYELVKEFRYVLIVSALSYLTVTIFHKKFLAPFESKMKPLRMILLLSSLIFPVSFHFAYHLSTGGHASKYYIDRYMLVFIPLITSVMAVGIDDFVKIAESFCARAQARYLIYAGIIMCLLPMFVHTLRNTEALFRAPTSDWRTLYRVINEDVKSGDVMILTSIIREGWYPPWYCQDIYFKEHVKDVTMLRGDVWSILDQLKSVPNYRNTTQKVYFTFYFLDNDCREVIENKENFRGEQFKYIDVNVLKTIQYRDDSKDLLDKVGFFLSYLIDILPETKAKRGLIERAIDIYREKGNSERVALLQHRLGTLR